MKKSLVLVVLVLVLFGNNKLNAQISVSSYSIHALGVQTSIGNSLAFELKMFVDPNVYLEEIHVEPTLYYRFRERTYHQFAAGLGFNFNFNGDLSYLTIPVQLEIFPFQDFKKLSVILELSLMFPYADPMLRHLLGIRYRFGSN